MSVRNSTTRRLVEQAIYQLKRQYGGPIDIYKYDSGSVDPETGITTLTKTVFPIRRAAILNGTVLRSVERTISVISANKQLVTGGTVDEHDRIFIVDRKDADLEAIELSEDDWVVYDNKKFSIQKYQDFDLGGGWIIFCKHLVGDRPEQIFNRRADSLIRLSQSATGVL